MQFCICSCREIEFLPSATHATCSESPELLAAPTHPVVRPICGGTGSAGTRRGSLEERLWKPELPEAEEVPVGLMVPAAIATNTN